MSRSICIVLTACLIAFPGCSDDDEDDVDPATRSLMDEWVEARKINDAVTCECDVESGLFESVEDCVTFTSALGGIFVECASPIYSEHAGVMHPLLECEIEAVRADTQCLEEAACDDDATDACFTQYTEASDACDPPPDDIMQELDAACSLE